ncbi:phenolic acid decarboxylase [Phyllobacterium brassicacearum]|uniref:Flavin prenyltransferase UbiX n=1 Tax=Phyllobacterium brassicacearum TaxID=314235 RepID=A0A2P7B693_9HYPH|nr:UbiX family flavin prenyltransferase [Phyllobacterium brassicacearum]PSH61976.1 phenolic acid decarboxylase [Phyllobacterium brassicacearum]TDQ14877.1 4-hydroxy-3-polyprenylbenzoate decarboxylase [Phyllobacterium brassicacearum]
MTPHHVVVAATGASGAAIPLRILERLATTTAVETHLVVSDAARRTFQYEVGQDAVERAVSLASRSYLISDVGAAIASGSFPTSGMIVAPCSMRTLAGIAAGLSDNLITRAADVHLKERRRLVLMTRETPLHLGHLRNMCAVTEMGAVIMPPVPAFYNLPQTVAEIVDHFAARAIDLLNLPIARQSAVWHGQL